MRDTASRREVLRGLGASGLLLGLGTGSARANTTVTTLFSYDPPDELPENVAIDPRGNKYVSFAPLGEVRKISPDNTTETPFASFSVNAGDFGLLGLEVTPSGVLYACLVTSPGADQTGVWRVDRDGTKSLYAAFPTGSFPNDILLDGGRLLVTDTTVGAVWEVREGDATQWVVDPSLAGTGTAGFGIPLGANGITRAKDGTVYVANTEKGLIVRIPVTPDGSAGTPETFVEDPRLFASDGLAIDTRDNIYDAVIGQDTIVRIAPDGTITTLATGDDGLDNPSDVTFGRARGEQKQLFVTNFALLSGASPSFATLDAGIPGAPIHR